MGVNPLAWVNPEKQPQQENMTAVGSPTVMGKTPSNEQDMCEAIFKTAGVENQEESMSNGKVKIRQTMNTTEAVSHLKDLAQSLESGIIRAEHAEKTVVMGVADSMEFELKLSRKKGKAKCSIEMEWLDDGSHAEGLKIKDK